MGVGKVGMEEAGVGVKGICGAHRLAGEQFTLHTASTFDNYLLDAAVSFSFLLKDRARASKPPRNAGERECKGTPTGIIPISNGA